MAAIDESMPARPRAARTATRSGAAPCADAVAEAGHLHRRAGAARLDRAAGCQGALSANPIAEVENELGLTALIFLVASLACTPARGSSAGPGRSGSGASSGCSPSSTPCSTS